MKGSQSLLKMAVAQIVSPSEEHLAARSITSFGSHPVKRRSSLSSQELATQRLRASVFGPNIGTQVPLSEN
jgi:hypothetical protein